MVMSTPVFEVEKEPPAAGRPENGITGGPFTPAAPGWMWAAMMLELMPVTFQVPVTVPAVASKSRVTDAVPVLLVDGFSFGPVSRATSLPCTSTSPLMTVGPCTWQW